MKLYICSSWRNPYYTPLVTMLRLAGYEIWDWRNPPTGGNGFKWQDVGVTDYKHGDKITVDAWGSALIEPVAMAGFASDLAGMNWCDVGILLHPAGRSAHLEAGWLAGRGKTVHVLCLEKNIEPDLMVLALNGKICGSCAELGYELGRVNALPEILPITAER